MTKKKLIGIGALMLLIGSFSVDAQESSFSPRVIELLGKMTLEEKIGQMNQYTGFFDVTGPAPEEGDAKVKYDQIRSGQVGSMLNVRGVDEVRKMQELAVNNSRLGIPLIFAFDVIHGLKTTFPIPLAEAASWDLEFMRKTAEAAAREAAASGLNWTFAPMVDISRDARWGRVMEGAGEDPFLASKVAAARVRGFQGDNLNDPGTILACAKHFAAYGFAEAGRDYNTTDLGMNTLHNVVLPPFRACIDAGVGSFMNAFNELNGIPATGDIYLQRDLLRKQWGFDGVMVSDWGSIGEMVPHGFAADHQHAGELALKAGCDMDMESRVYIAHLKKSVKTGAVEEAFIDEAVGRILQAKEDLGLLDDPYLYCNTDREEAWVESNDHQSLALEMAKRSVVLLKNDNDLLPLAPEGLRIGLIGHLAASKTSPLGNWRLAAEPESATSVLEAMQADGRNEISYARGPALFSGQENFVFPLAINNDNASGIDEAVNLARNSDLVVMVLGEHGLMTGEGRSRTDLGLPGLQQQLLEAVMRVNQKVVLVLMSGRPLTIEWAAEEVPAIIAGWQLGCRSGEAINAVLYGDYNPSGKLPMTFPRNVGQVPLYYNHRTTGRPGPNPTVFWSAYRDSPNTPLYAFGHGLSYTTFTYSNLRVEAGASSAKVWVDVSNSGQRGGEEVVQLYVRDKVASCARPIKELKGFQKINLQPYEKRTLEFVLEEEALGFFNHLGNWTFEAGEFTISVGGSSITTLEQDVEIR